MEPLEKELKTLEAHRDELLGADENKYVLIHGDTVAGTYESESDAINEGYRQFGNVPFLVKQVVATERPLNFLSGMVRL
jgi:hypothetical protein